MALGYFFLCSHLHGIETMRIDLHGGGELFVPQDGLRNGCPALDQQRAKSVPQIMQPNLTNSGLSKHGHEVRMVEVAGIECSSIQR